MALSDEQSLGYGVAGFELLPTCKVPAEIVVVPL
jgi:hypothetical protein